MILRMAAAIAAAAAACSPAAAQQTKSGKEREPAEKESRGEFSAEVSAGVEYDSNLAVVEVDQSTGAEDFSANLEVELGYEREFGQGTTFEAGYDFSQSLHFDFPDFDIQSHRGSVSLEQDFGRIDAGASYDFIYSTLDREGFISYHLLSPYASAFIGENLLTRVAYSYADKNFIDRIDRDATIHAGAVDAYYFWNGRRTYLLLGYKYESENAVDPQFDFTAHTIRARLSQRFSLAGARAQGRVGWRYENRDYDAVTLSIGEIRDDRRHRIEAELEVDLTDRIFAELEARRNFLNSNLPSVDYNENVIAARLGARF